MHRVKSWLWGLIEWAVYGPPRCLDCGARLRAGKEFCNEEHRASYEENLPWR